MRLVVFEDREVGLLDPLTLTRPALDLRCGASSLLEHQRLYFRAEEVGALVRPELADLCRRAHPGVAVNDPDWLRRGAAVVVNARWLPPDRPAEEIAAPRVALAGERVAYAILPPDRLAAATADGLAEWLAGLAPALPRGPAGGAWIRYPWDLIEYNAAALNRAAPRYGRAPSACPTGPAVLGPADRLFIDPSAKVEPLVLLDTRKGPVVIDRGAVVKAFSRLEGPCYVGPETWVLAAHVAASSLGPVCRVGGEVEGSVIHGHSNKAHGGFLGHSYVGEWVNLAAGTQVSDLRADYQPVTMTVAGQAVPTGLTKVGAFFGDHTKTGINTLFNTGTRVGAFCQVFPADRMPPRVVPSFCAFARGQLRPADGLDPLFATAAVAMGRRGQEWTPAHAEFFRGLHARTAAERARAAGGPAGKS
jgi:UDP-N-acetylglucosamine diphosphorylase/glucosamine-1-phosphate N-acetyltransferase